MSATSTPTTFSDLYTDLINRVRDNSSTTAIANYARRYINQALHDLHIQNNFPWAERRAVLQTHATYQDGTVAIALATRTTVTGTSTLWNTAVTGMGFNNARAGGKMTFDNIDVYTVSAVGSDTAITLTDRYVGDTALSGASYTYFEDEYALASDFFRLVDARTFTDALDLEVLSRQEFYRRYPRNAHTGTPQKVTLIELGPSGDVNPRPRAVFYPAPDRVLNIPYRYITANLAVSSGGTAQTNLSADTDEPIVPVRYRHVLVFYALYQWYRDRKDDVRTELARAEYENLLTRITNDTAPERDIPRLRTNRRRYLAGVAGFRRSSRYTTGTAFDEMRD